MIASVFMLTIVGTIVTDRIVESRLGKYEGGITEKVSGISTVEKKGLLGVFLSFIVIGAAIALLIVPEWTSDTHQSSPS